MAVKQKKGNDGMRATPKSTPRNQETNPAKGKDSGRGTPTVTK